MEKRLLLAIALMVGLMIVSNVVFPPVPAPVAEGDSIGAIDSVSARADSAAPATVGRDSAAPAGEAAQDSAGAEAAAFAERLGQEAAQPEPELEAATTGSESEVVAVRSDLYEYRFDARGARLVGATLLAYPNFAEDRDDDGPVQIVRSSDALFGYTVTTGQDTVRLADLVFSTSSGDITVGEGGAALTFERALGGEGVTFEVTYRFSADDYRIDVEGGLRGIGDQGYSVLLGLGRGLKMNEANPREDFGQMAMVTRSRSGDIASENLGRLEPGEIRPLGGGPFSWAASKSKYFLAAVVAPEDAPGIGGVLMEGVEEENASRTTATLPVPGGSGGFRLIAYVGPQDHDRLQAIGQDLQGVNPFGWKFLQWFIRPFGELVIALLVWMHGAFSLAYGWVLILFGVLTRIILFPLYQKSMRSQMKQMAIQPEMKKLQERYKEEPQKLQQEMMKLYKEAGVSPLGGCLPMLLPFPILITLFFVFQNTIEFRGVPFLWLPDLSLKDPLYIIPLMMGASMLGLNWIGQRGIESNQQTKVITYVLPVVFTFMFAQFAAGLNLYYTASNIASLPQQLYLSKERRAHQAKRKPSPDSGGTGKAGASGKRGGTGGGGGRTGGGSGRK
jgi:YidC/Oxa1 family membrane protein insertase